ncbi:DUF1292 domain-containing protein [Selenihalanaerobacter shriftii]|uniref:DUF1292 domain-containing protein n=1 Tax=Selenihalanaerobacter shriftii TaxID=142842 RepID=A0A1T4QLD9_9FIRM|nr:DUF1292 domain-containing protein [Selenihalanaerobacter shriftii]SKA04525.1 Protein of unknown function [Selenihalanaerobacter shriftii]
MAEEGKINKFNLEEGVAVLEEVDGTEIKFSIEDELEIEGNQYFILVREDELDLGEGYALKLTTDDSGTEVLLPIDNEEELAKVQNEIERLYQ